MAIFIDLDGDENNESKDLTKKLIEKELEKINTGQNIIKNMYSATDEALKSAQSKATMQDTLTKEIQDKILKDQREELYKLASTTRPIQFVPSKKSTPPTVNNINITHSPLVSSENKKKWYERPLGILWLSIVASLLVGLLFYTYSPP
ncbi:MAG: hypothetical protein WCJ37_16530 [Syntrophus sp. (in: bacteria)]